MSQKVKGFKAMRPDMTCRDFKFKLGKKYKHKGEIRLCQSGFHFCRDIENVEYFYPTDCRIFEVEASGVIDEDKRKTATDTLKIIKEIDYMDYINHSNWWLRSVVANKSIGLDILVHDSNFLVRQQVARQGYGLDVLVNDSSWVVRLEVAKQGYGLDVLINDRIGLVREAVARLWIGYFDKRPFVYCSERSLYAVAETTIE